MCIFLIFSIDLERSVYPESLVPKSEEVDYRLGCFFNCKQEGK